MKLVTKHGQRSDRMGIPWKYHNKSHKTPPTTDTQHDTTNTAATKQLRNSETLLHRNSYNQRSH